jgi:3-hydroxybutyryl-CoA dehydrogenase
MDVKTIGVIAAGTLGRRIAYAAAIGRYRTVLEDVSPAMLREGVACMQEAHEEGIARGRVASKQKDLALANLVTVRSVPDACREADLLIEAVPEEMEVKLEISTIFDKFAKPNAILASTAPTFPY